MHRSYLVNLHCIFRTSAHGYDTDIFIPLVEMKLLSLESMPTSGVPISFTWQISRFLWVPVEHALKYTPWMLIVYSLVTTFWWWIGLSSHHPFFVGAILLGLGWEALFICFKESFLFLSWCSRAVYALWLLPFSPSYEWHILHLLYYLPFNLNHTSVLYKMFRKKKRFRFSCFKICQFFSFLCLAKYSLLQSKISKTFYHTFLILLQFILIA